MAEQRTPRDERLVAAFESKEEADAAAAAAQEAGVEADDVRVGDRHDHVASVRAEMHEEVEHSVMGPGNFGPFTKEMTKGLVLGTLVLTPLLALLALPLAARPFFPAGVSLGVRLVIAGAIGALTGATLGFVLGGGMAHKPEEEQEKTLAAERGVVVGVQSDDPARAEKAAEALKQKEPQRLDVIGPGGEPVGPVED